MISSSLISAIVTPIAVGIVLTWLMNSAKPQAEKNGEWHIMHWPKGWHILMWLFLIICVCMTLSIALFPNEHIQMVLIIAAVVITVLALLSVCSLYKSIVYWNSIQLAGANLWGKRSTINWDDVNLIDYNELGYFKIKDHFGNVVYISPYQNGFTELIPKLNIVLKKLGMDIIEIGDSTNEPKDPGS